MRKGCIVFGLFVLLLLLGGCKDTVFEEDVVVSDRSVDHTFAFPEGSDTYEVQLKVRYDIPPLYKKKVKDRLVGDLISPSGKKYHAIGHLNFPSKPTVFARSGGIITFSDITYEDGDFTLHVEKGVTSIRFDEGTLFVNK